MQKKTVFISHISTESALAEALKLRLQRDFLGMLEVFVSPDRSTIAAGSKWLEEVQRALESTALVLVLASKSSIIRPWVNVEAGAAWLRGIAMIPVCHSGLQPTDLPAPFSSYQAIHFADAVGLRKLYDAAATQLGVDTPATDFTALAQELAAVEGRHANALHTVDVVQRPRILVAANPQFAEPAFGFDLDVAAIEAAFPSCTVVERGLTRRRLFTLLTTQQFDIVHLVMPVHADTGELIFSAVDTMTNLPVGPAAEVMTPSSFSSLLVESKTRLVVLATCRALLLAVEVAAVANMAASDADISGRQAAEWAECFYGLLAQGRSLHRAFDLTRSQIHVPIRAVRQRDVAFAVATAAS